VLLGPHVSAVPCCLALQHPATTHWAPLSPGANRPPLTPASLTSRRPLLSRGNAAAHVHQLGANAICLSRPPPRTGSFFISCSRPPCGAHPWTPLPPSFPLCRAPERVQKPLTAVPSRPPLLSAHSHPRSSMPPPPSSLDLVHWPRMLGSPLPSPSSAEPWPPVIRSVSR
jgi:hypothetical protein